MFGSRTSRWTAGALALCVLLLVAFWFLLVGPRRADAAALRDQRDQVNAANDTLTLEIAQLKAQAAALPARQADLAKIQREFPPQVQLPKLIRDLDTFATQSGVTLQALTPGTPTAVTSAATGGTAAGSGTAAAGPQAASVALLQVPVSMQVTGDYFQVASFVKRVQQMERASLITGTTIVQSQNADTPGTVDVTLTGSVFVLPDAGTGDVTGAGQPPAPGTASSGTTIQ